MLLSLSQAVEFEKLGPFGLICGSVVVSMVVIWKQIFMPFLNRQDEQAKCQVEVARYNAEAAVSHKDAALAHKQAAEANTRTAETMAAMVADLKTELKELRIKSN